MGRIRHKTTGISAAAGFVLALSAFVQRPLKAEDDGRLFDIAFINALNQVVILEVHEEGMGFERVLELPEGEKDRLISEPKTRRLAFLYRDDEEYKHYLYYHDLRTEDSRKVATFRFKSPTYPAFSPDGNFLCYVDKAKKEDKHDVFAVSVTGKRPKVLSKDLKVWDGPVFVDRRTVIFGTVTDTEYSQSLDAHFLGGRKPKSLLTSLEVPHDVAKKRVKPNFSPASVDVWRKGKRILWIDWGEETPAVLQIRQTTTAGGKSQWMTKMKRNVIAARYSPDGARIALLVAGEKLGLDDLFVMWSNGKDLKKLATINKQPFRGWMFTWGLHSKHVVYLHNPSKKSGSMREIHLAHIDGSEPRRLTDNDMCESYPACLAPGEDD